MGVQQQAQIAIFILFASILTEIVSKPYHFETERHKVLPHLELISQISLWCTMWCGTLIFAFHTRKEEGIVILLSFVVAALNLCTMILLIFSFLLEYAFENKESNFFKTLFITLQRFQTHHKIAALHFESKTASACQTVELTTVINPMNTFSSV